MSKSFCKLNKSVQLRPCNRHAIDWTKSQLICYHINDYTSRRHRVSPSAQTKTIYNEFLMPCHAGISMFKKNYSTVTIPITIVPIHKILELKRERGKLHFPAAPIQTHLPSFRLHYFQFYIRFHFLSSIKWNQHNTITIASQATTSSCISTAIVLSLLN